MNERFWTKVDRSGDCWIWKSAVGDDGYGLFWVDKHRRAARAHRLALELSGVCLPHGCLVMHRCDNRLCVRPAHLFVGSHDANMKDMAQKKRAVHGQRHHKTTLTVEQVKQIRACGRSLAEYKRLAADLGVTFWTIQRIRLGTSWRHA